MRWLLRFSDALTALRRRFHGDLDLLLIWLVFVQAQLSASSRNGVNALSLADVTSIPRETVRRKLSKLAETGIVARGPDGLWRLQEEGRLDISGELEHLSDPSLLSGSRADAPAR